MDIPWQYTMADESEITSGQNSVRVAPARGGLITGFTVNGVDVLFMDRSTLIDPAKNVRGGIPLLFPNAGKLPNDSFIASRFEHGQAVVCDALLMQHGYARRNIWTMYSHTTNQIAMRLQVNNHIREQYPYDVTLLHQVELHGSRLRISLTIENNDTDDAPFASGWHPYFAIPHAEKTAVQSKALGADVLHRMNDAAEYNFSVPFHGEVDVKIPALPPFVMRASPEHRIVQCWSLPGRDFVCIEPWVNVEGALNDRSKRLSVPAHSAMTLWMEIQVG